jgi:hypothetical protein
VSKAARVLASWEREKERWAGGGPCGSYVDHVRDTCQLLDPEAGKFPGPGGSSALAVIQSLSKKKR